jgi:hypothetical protein
MEVQYINERNTNLTMPTVTFSGFRVCEVGGRGFGLDSWGSNPRADLLAQRVLPFKVMGRGFRV